MSSSKDPTTSRSTDNDLSPKPVSNPRPVSPLDQSPKYTDVNVSSSTIETVKSPSVDNAAVTLAADKPSPDKLNDAADGNQAASDKAAKEMDNEQTKGNQQKRLDELELKYGARHVVLLFKPVAICMLFSIFITKVIEELQPGGRKEAAHPVFFVEGQDHDTGSEFGNTAVNALIVISGLIVMSFVLVACVMYCFKVMMVFLVFEMTLINVFAEGILIKGIFGSSNIPVDYITGFLLVYNFSVTTMLATFWKGPRIIEQVFLVVNCACFSSLLNRIIPGPAVMAILALLVLWDLFAVLAPFGPLRLLINHMKESDKELGQGLVYTAGVMGFEPGTVTKPKRATAGGEADVVQEDTVDKEPEQVDKAPVEAKAQLTAGNDAIAAIAAPTPVTSTTTPVTGIPDTEKMKGEGEPEKKLKEKVAEGDDEEEEYEEGNIKLGLGDFIFYSLLISRASMQSSMTTVIACFVCVLVGLASTLVILAIYQKALPAIPISIVLALIFYFLGDLAMAPFLNDLAFSQIII